MLGVNSGNKHTEPELPAGNRVIHLYFLAVFACEPGRASEAEQISADLLLFGLSVRRSLRLRDVLHDAMRYSLRAVLGQPVSAWRFFCRLLILMLYILFITFLTAINSVLVIYLFFYLFTSSFVYLVLFSLVYFRIVNC